MGKNDKVSYYYNDESITINKENNIINVWIKYILTDKGKKFYMDYNKKKGKDITNYNDFSQILELVMYDYKKMNNTTMYFIESSESEDVLGSGKNFDIEWNNIISESVKYGILKRILEDYDLNK